MSCFRFRRTCYCHGFITPLPRIFPSFSIVNASVAFHQAIAQKIKEKNNLSGNKGLQNQNIHLTVNNKILLANLLANNLENRLSKSAAILEITSKLTEIRKVPFTSSINTTLHGIPKETDLAKRKVAQDILSKYKDTRYPATCTHE